MSRREEDKYQGSSFYATTDRPPSRGRLEQRRDSPLDQGVIYPHQVLNSRMPPETSLERDRRLAQETLADVDRRYTAAQNRELDARYAAGHAAARRRLEAEAEKAAAEQLERDDTAPGQTQRLDFDGPLRGRSPSGPSRGTAHAPLGNFTTISAGQPASRSGTPLGRFLPKPRRHSRDGRKH
ncbi:hypothetical protein JCM10207_004128 [Rhodosporidiobolus poonsookiae]